jgi:hypothetical protein
MDFQKKFYGDFNSLQWFKNYTKKFYAKKPRKNVKIEKLEISIKTTLQQMA